MPSILSLAVVDLLIAPVQAATVPSESLQPPAESSLPDNAFGEMVRQGQAPLVKTRKNTPHLVGSQLNCANCHLEQGRRANSAPQRAACSVYPAFYAKNNKVNTFAERLQGCFQFSMNDKVPAADSPEIKVLTVYAYRLASQTPIGVSLPGRGYPGVAPPEGGYSIERSAKVYAVQCVIYHGIDGQGQMALGQAVSLPLWGVQPFNWGADMHRINTTASFIKYSMPLGKPGIPSDRDARDVAAFMNSHERPQDLRLADDSTEKTRQKFHTNDGVSLYGQKVNDVLPGQEIRLSWPGVRGTETRSGGSRSAPEQGG